MGELSGSNTYITFPTEADVTSQGSPNTGQDILVSSLLLLALLLSEHFSLGASVFQPVKWRWLKRKQKLNRRFSLDITWTSHSEPEQRIRQDRFRESMQVKKSVCNTVPTSVGMEVHTYAHTCMSGQASVSPY